MQARPISSCGVCLSVCPSVRLLRSRVVSKRNKPIIIFLPLGSHAILVFLCQRHNNIPTGIPLPLTGASNAGGVGRNRDSEPMD